MIKPKTAEKQMPASKENTIHAASSAKKSVSKKSGKILSSKLGGVGRRKSSVARVWMTAGSGKLTVNDKPMAQYFPTEQARFEAVKPLMLLGALQNYNIDVNVVGGGYCSQADAVKLGIARALVKENETLRGELKSHGLLTVDSRLKERKKPGQKAARRKFQFVKR